MTCDKFLGGLRIAAPMAVEVKADDSGMIEGFASTYGGEPDRQGDVIRAGAFSKSIERHNAEGTSPAMLWSHKIEAPIGKWSVIEERADGLFVSGRINLQTERGREAFQHAKAGDVGAFSIGFSVPDGGRKYLGNGVFELGEIDLYEISLVAVPANPKARITGVKQINSKSDAVSFLRDAGLSKDAARRFAAGGFPAISDQETAAKSLQLANAMDAAIEKMKAGQ